MNSYYNPNYDLNSFPQDPAIDTLINLFANVNTSPWNDVSDNDNGATDGDVDLTYSFIPNGVATDSRRNTTNTFATFDRIFGAGNWQHIFGDALNLWASASNGKLSFSSHADYRRPFNYRVPPRMTRGPATSASAATTSTAPAGSCPTPTSPRPTGAPQPATCTSTVPRTGPTA